MLNKREIHLFPRFLLDDGEHLFVGDDAALGELSRYAPHKLLSLLLIEGDLRCLFAHLPLLLYKCYRYVAWLPESSFYLMIACPSGVLRIIFYLFAFTSISDLQFA